MTKIKINCNRFHIIIMLNINNVRKAKLNLPCSICVLFYSSFVWISAYANVSFNMRMYTSINTKKSEVHCGSAVGFGQVLPGFLITAPPSVCVSAVLGALALWIQNQKKEKIYQK